MADYHSRYKIHPQSYVAVQFPDRPATLRDLYRREAPKALKSCSKGEVWGHDCREPVVQDYQTNHDWDVYVLSHALNSTFDDRATLSATPHQSETKKVKNKLIFHIGNTEGSKVGATRCDFNYPRGLAISFSGDIIVADSLNHRLQVFNAFGTFRAIIGKLGSGDEEFWEPTDVATMPNDDIVVADFRNCRIQVIRMRRFVFLHQFSTHDPPFTVATDNYSNTVVGTRKRTVEIYRSGGKLVSRFAVHSAAAAAETICTSMRTKQMARASAKERAGPVYVSVNSMMDTIVLSDPVAREVKTYDYSGSLLHRFSPAAAFGDDISTVAAPADGLAAAPGGVVVDSIGQIVMCDTLNHTVNLYSERGILVRVLCSSSDGVGAAQACAVGPEGHLIVAQYCAGGYHSVKIMRYLDCACHKHRPSSSKRPQTPIYE